MKKNKKAKSPRRKKLEVPTDAAPLSKVEELEVKEFVQLWTSIFRARKELSRWGRGPRIRSKSIALDRAILKRARQTRGMDAINAITIASRRQTLRTTLDHDWKNVLKALAHVASALGGRTFDQLKQSYDAEDEYFTYGIHDEITDMGFHPQRPISASAVDLVVLLCDDDVQVAYKTKGPQEGALAFIAKLYGVSRSTIAEDIRIIRGK